MNNSRLLAQKRMSMPWPIVVITEAGCIFVVYSREELRWATSSNSPMKYYKFQLGFRSYPGPVIPCVAFSQANVEQLNCDTENVFAAKILHAPSPEFVRTVRTALLTIISDPKRRSVSISESQISTATAQELWTFCVNNFGPWDVRSRYPNSKHPESDLFYDNLMLRREQFFRMLIPAIKTEFPTLAKVQLYKFDVEDLDELSLFFKLNIFIPHPAWPQVHVQFVDYISIYLSGTGYSLGVNPDQDSPTKCVEASIAQLKHISRGGAMFGNKFLDIDKLQRAGIFSRLFHFFGSFYSLSPW